MVERVGPIGRRTRRRVAIIAGLVVGTALLVLLKSTDWLASLGGRVIGERLERARRSPQFAGGKFRNPQPSPMTTGSVVEMMRRQFFGGEQRSPAKDIPLVRRSANDYVTPHESGLRATWIGWSSVLIEIDGRRVLTDPIWSERCSPSTLVGPKRFHEPPIPLSEVPSIDVVVISHDHYDHLDMPTIKALAARGTKIAVAVGVGAHLERWGVPPAQIAELDWNQGVEINGLSITSTPARHFSGRNPLHNNQTLWTSWVVKGPMHRIFYSGDTGYFDGFKTIGATHGPFDLTLIKIGAYDRSWPYIHVNPEQAVQAHIDLGGRMMLPVHWATFNLGIHAWREPADRVVAAAEKARVNLVVPKPGEFVEPVMSRSIERWWE